MLGLKFFSFAGICKVLGGSVVGLTSFVCHSHKAITLKIKLGPKTILYVFK